MRALLEIAPLTAEALEELYRTTKDPRLRTRAQIVLLAGEQRLRVWVIAKIVREVTQTVRKHKVSSLDPDYLLKKRRSKRHVTGSSQKTYFIRRSLCIPFAVAHFVVI